MHAGQLEVDEQTVRALLADQHPQWAGLDVRVLPQSGTVNAIARIGDDLAARFPLQPGEPADVRRNLAQEADAARRLAGRLSVPVPEVVALGEPGRGYPLPWSVQTWLPGDDGSVVDPGTSYAFARDLARLVTDLRAVPTQGRTFVGERRTNRGGVIADHDPWVLTCLDRSAGLLDVSALAALWDRFRDLPRGPEPDLTTHGDLIPSNVLVTRTGVAARSEARLAGLLDVGGTGPADPALDLVGAWHLLEDGPRTTFRQALVLHDALGCDDEQWARGVAWAFEQAIGLVWYYRTSNPPFSAFGRRSLDRILRAVD
jgi:aminoglycoside phosphotransferase (APT) family kinase protein